MIALIIIIAVLLIINLTPIGVDGGYENGEAFGFAKIGPFRMRVFPQPELTEEQKQLAAEKKAQKKEAAAAKKQAKAEKEAAKRAKKGLPAEEPVKKKLDLDFILELARMGLHALKRFRHRLSVDLFKLHFTAGGDPYSAAMTYGYTSAAFGLFLPLLDDAFVIHERDVQIGADLENGQMSIDARLILTIQLWEIMYVALAFGAEFIKYKSKNRREKARPDAEAPKAA